MLWLPLSQGIHHLEGLLAAASRRTRLFEWLSEAIREVVGMSWSPTEKEVAQVGFSKKER